ncbi:carboxylesterase family protein [Kribbella sp. NBC_00382]|uniref:carboxylesterase/lipase family protein n=1 Tax=Kribbella sp. NBC_00382 TaxID=2975967 RepID=UPI002E1D447C
MRRLLGLGAVLLLLTACNKNAVPGSDTLDPVVRTDAGDVRGVVHDDHRVFNGIPYAAPPVGDLRWTPPAPVKPWTGERAAIKPGSPCPQVKSAIADLSSDNEDCLFLNLTTPHSASPQNKKPVMVWIHGDGAIGSGDQFDPTRLAVDGDVVVITFNYRLGVFGAFGHPELEDSGTIGLQDQRAVLRWVQRNVAAFGGDPGNVTLFGVSYGATATGAHLMSSLSRGLFHKVIMQSGFTLMDLPAGALYPGIPALPWLGWTTTAGSASQGQALAKQLGCEDLACLRKVPVAKILAVPQVMNIFQAYALGNAQLPADPAQALADGNFAEVPVLAGTTRDEHTTFVAFFRELAGQPVTAAGYPELLRTAFGADAQKVLAEYPLKDYPTPARAWASVITDRMWAQAQLRQNQLLSAKNPLWFYEFADRDAPTDIPFPKGFDPGAWHGGDVGYLFRDAEGAAAMRPDQVALSDTMIAYWTNFAHRGDPNGSGVPEWKRFSTPDTVQSLAPGKIAPVGYSAEHQLEFWRGLGH